MSAPRPLAIVAGVGPGPGSALCRQLAAAGYAVGGLARDRAHLDPVADAILAAGGTARMYPCDLTRAEPVRDAFSRLFAEFGPPEVLIYNAGAIARHPFAETPAETFDTLWETNCRGAFLCARETVPQMLERGAGTLLFTGATAGVKAGAEFAAFASAKFALRGLAQSLARELGPRGIHVAHVVIDGIIWSPRTAQRPGVTPANTLHPDAIARTYLALIAQDRSAWTQELDLRPDCEPF